MIKISDNKTVVVVRVEAGIAGRNVEHNNRDFVADNIDKERIKDNIIYKQEDLKIAYDKLFSTALKEYNERQSRADRKIDNYLEHIENSKKEKSFYEAVIQYGNKDSNGVGTQNGEQAKKMLDEYMTDFQKRNPNLYVFNAVLHMDEATPHLHINFVPFATNQKQGLPTRVSLKKALEQQGISGKSIKESDRQQWALTEKPIMISIAEKYGIQIGYKGIHRKNLNPDDYKVYANSKEFNENKKSLKGISVAEAENIKNHNIVLKKKLEEATNKLNTKRKDFIIADEQKHQFITNKLKAENIDFSVEGQIIRVPVWAEKRINELQEAYKPPQISLRERARLDIDSLIYSSKSVENLWEALQRKGYEIKQGKFTSIKPNGAERFIRTKSLGDEYTETALIGRIAAANNLARELNGTINRSIGIEKEFLLVYKSTYMLFVGQKKEPQKIEKSKPFSIKNDKNINELSNCLRIIQTEKLSSEADIINQMELLDSDINSHKNRIKELQSMQEAITDVKNKAQFYFRERDSKNNNFMQEMRIAAAKDILDEYGIESEADLLTLDETFSKNQQELAVVNQNLNTENEKLSSYAKLLNVYEQIQDGGYINSLTRKELETNRSSPRIN